MGAVRVIEVNKDLFEEDSQKAETIRKRLKAEGTYLLNIMASPGAGKTSVLLRTISMLQEQGKRAQNPAQNPQDRNEENQSRSRGESYQIGVMEADIDASVDAEKMEKAGVRSIQIHTGGECAMNADMTLQALEEFETRDLDFLFLENVGNLVCPAEEDVGASARIEILSIPEGDDKPLKYPLMFQVVDAVLINKIDTRQYFAFDDQAVVERIHRLNPTAEVFFVSARTGEGFEAWIEWLMEQQRAWTT